MAKKQAQSSSLLIALGGPAIILCLYAVYVQVNPSEAATQVVRLETDLETIQKAEVSMQQHVQVAERLRVEKENLADAQSRLDDLRRQASELMRGEISGMDELRYGSQINHILTTAGLRLVDDHPVSSQANDSGMLRTLADATKNLGDTLTSLASDDADNTPITLPPDLPLDVNPIEWMAGQRALRVGKFSGPKTRGSELKLVGDYRSMVAGLEAVVDACPGVVVSSVAFEKPSVRTPGAIPLIWNVQLQMRPLPPGSVTSPSDEMTARSEARQEFQPSPSESIDDARYMVTKPIVGDAD